MAGWNSTPGSVVTGVMSEMVMLRGLGLSIWLNRSAIAATTATPAAHGTQRGRFPSAMIGRVWAGVVPPLGVASGSR
jgi:hypothetical protein